MSCIDQLLEDINSLEKTIWNYFSLGVINKKSSFNCPSIATLNSNNNNFTVRTLILRKVVYSKHHLVFYTDNRSTKVSDILLNKNVVVHVYDREKNIQVQCYGKAAIINNCAQSKKIWDNLSSNSKKNYASKKKPGKKISSWNINTLVKDDKAFINFSIIRVDVKSLVFLYLSRDINKKVEFKYRKKGFKINWMVP